LFVGGFVGGADGWQRDAAVGAVAFRSADVGDERWEPFAAFEAEFRLGRGFDRMNGIYGDVFWLGRRRVC
jgi:hypothetical protein